MATETDQLQPITEVATHNEQSVESLQNILASERHEAVSYQEAQALGYELIAFFMVLNEPNEVESDDGDSAI